MIGSKFLKRSAGLGPPAPLLSTFRFAICLSWLIDPSGLILPPRPPAGDIILSRGCGFGEAIDPFGAGPVEGPLPEEPLEGDIGTKCLA